MTGKTLIALGVLSMIAAACGGAQPEPATPATPGPAAAAEPAGVAAPEDEVAAPEAPRQVTVSKVEIEGGGIDEKGVREAMEPVASAWESCFSSALGSAPEAGGRVFVTFLYVKGERKSVSASYSGAGAESINPCFQKASSDMKLAPASSADRTVITIELALAKKGG
jgi:hypothetical protein